VVRRHVLEGEIPSPINLPPGCHFASRCPVAAPRCAVDAPRLEGVGTDNAHRAACLRIAEGANRIPVMEEMPHG
jgi:oligopeptide/dipeptide ABC transporter ATP-binding protein